MGMWRGKKNAKKAVTPCGAHKRLFRISFTWEKTGAVNSPSTRENIPYMHLPHASTVLFGVAKKYSIPPTPFDSIDFNRPYTKPASALLHTPPWRNQDGGPRVRIVIEVSTCGSVTLLAPSFPRTIQGFKACLSFNSATSRNAVILVRKSSLCGNACLWTFAYHLLHDLF